MFKIISIIILIMIIVPLFLYLIQDKSRKRFIRHLLKQVPYLIGRYFA